MPSTWTFSVTGQLSTAPPTVRATTTLTSASQIEQRFDDAVAVELRERSVQLGRGGHAALTLAVVAELGGLDDCSGLGELACATQVRIVEVGAGRDIRSDRNAVIDEKRLLDDSVLGDRDGVCRWGDHHRRGQVLEGLGRGVLEFGGHDRALAGESAERWRVVVGGDHVLVGDDARRRGGVGIYHDGPVAHGIRGDECVLAELAPAEHADGGRGNDRFRWNRHAGGGSTDDAAASRRSARYCSSR